MTPTVLANTAPLLLDVSLVGELLGLYNVQDPRKPDQIIEGYDRPHALRTAKMCAAVALKLGHDFNRVKQYQIACVLHDLGRAGLDRELFGSIWSWARRNGIPTRPREWRAKYPNTIYGKETESFLEKFGPGLESEGILLDDFAKEQVEMRLGYARRLTRILRWVGPRLTQIGIVWEPWMEAVMLYYYYPEKLEGAQDWVHQLGEILVACEQFEAFNNRQRGGDYYTRSQESLKDAFIYLDSLKKEGILSQEVMTALGSLAASGAFDEVLAEARGEALSIKEQQVLRSQLGVTA